MARQKSISLKDCMTRDEAIEHAGATLVIWNQAHRTANPRPPVVGHHPETGKKLYARKDVEAWRVARERSHNARSVVLSVHQRIEDLIDGVRTVHDIAALVGVHYRTVQRHLRGECQCLSKLL